MSKRETSSEIDEAASHWALRADEGDLTAAERAELDAWLEGDVRRLGAFVRAQAVLVHVMRARALGSDFDPASFHPDIAMEQGPAEPDAHPAPILTRRRMLAGASAIAAGGAFAFLVPAMRATAKLYETGRGEIRLVPLADGSTVTLNTDSKIAVTMDGGHRRVQLLAGEALFKVATGGREPFTVEADMASMRTRSAIFSVCRLAEQPLQVQVCEGDVEVARNNELGGGRMLHANMQATMPADGPIIGARVAAATLERQLSWQEGMLSFEDTPLHEAARQFARYSDRRISLSEAAVGAETVTGRYAANDPEGFARAAALSLNLHMQKTPDGIILAR